MVSYKIYTIMHSLYAFKIDLYKRISSDVHFQTKISAEGLITVSFFFLAKTFPLQGCDGLKWGLL